MIQRIQSLFILIYIIFGIIPFYSFTDVVSVHGTLSLNRWCLQSDISSNAEIIYSPFFLSGLLHTLSCIIAFIALLNYKDRKKQLKLLTISACCVFLESIFVAFFVAKLVYLSESTEEIKFKIGLILLLIAPFFILAAKYFVKKDELMIHSSNRFI